MKRSIKLLNTLVWEAVEKLCKLSRASLATNCISTCIHECGCTVSYIMCFILLCLVGEDDNIQDALEVHSTPFYQYFLSQVLGQNGKSQAKGNAHYEIMLSPQMCK